MDNNDLYKDSDLVELIAKGDHVAFTKLFDRYRDALYSLAWSLTRSFDVADDILQEVFLKIWLKRTELKEIENFHGYLVIVTRRVILNELRRLGRIKLREDSFKENAPLTSFDDLVDRLQEKQYTQILQKGLQQLSEQQAMVFHLIKQQGYSREEASKELNLSQETVKKHLERAMRTIRAFMLANLDNPLLWALITLSL